MPIIGVDGQPINLTRAIGAQKLESFAPLPQGELVELRGMVEQALAGGVPPEQTVAIPLGTVAQLLATLQAATVLLIAQDSPRPPWFAALDDEGTTPQPWTTRVTYWQDETMQIERWHAPPDGEPHVGVIGHGANVYEALEGARPLPPATLLQIGLDLDLDPLDAIFPVGREPIDLNPLMGGEE